MSTRGRVWLLLSLVGIQLTVGARAWADCPQNPSPSPTAEFRGFKGRVFEKDGQRMPYRLFVPLGYDPSKAYPLVLYLHHAGLAGTDNCGQLSEEAGSGGYGGVFVHAATAADKTLFDTQAKYPHFLVAPQASSSKLGFGGGVEGSASAPEHPTRALVFGILDALGSEFNIDARRRYITGISMGCYGTWDIIMRRPDYFAAASPQSCQGDPDRTLLSNLTEMPIWSMCGTSDHYFPGAEAMASAMIGVGAKHSIFTPFQHVGHSIHDLGYDYPGFIDWMFAQSLPAPLVDTAGGGAAGANISGSAGAGATFVDTGGVAGTMYADSLGGASAGTSTAAAPPVGMSGGATANAPATAPTAPSCSYGSAERFPASVALAVAAGLLLRLGLFRRRGGT